MNKFLRNKKGFTLTEMIVVIAIIGILASVMIPSVVVYIKKAKQNSAYQQAVAIINVHKTYQTELAAGLIIEYGHKDGSAHVDDIPVDANNPTIKGDNICDKCNGPMSRTIGDNKYEDFNDYYEELLGIKLSDQSVFVEGKFTYVADNGITVIIDLSDMSAIYK